MERKTKLKLMVIWAKFAAILFTLPIAAQSFDQHQAKLDTYLTTLSDNNKIMTAVYVTDSGVPRYEHYAGLASVEGNVPISAQTRFRIGSVTKTFTAVLIMQLIENNKLSLDTKLNQFYPAIPNAAQINIKHLLSHRSGIFNYTNDPDYMSFMTTPQTEEQLISRIRGYQPEFSPGSKHKYSNSNYVLLGFIIESLYGQPLQEVIARNITQPLNLDSTYYGNSIEIEENEASSYRYNAHWVKHPETHMSAPHGAGAIVSNAKDTNEFFTALFEGKLVSNDSLSAMMKLEDGYGLGMTAAPFGEKQFYGHFGSIDGFVSAAGYNTEDGLNITVLSNAVNYNFNEVLIAVLKTMYGHSIDIPDFSAKSITLSEKVLSSFEGQFASTQIPIKIRFWVEDGRLMSQGEGQGAVPLTAYLETKFRFDPAGLVINFEEPNSSSNRSNGFVLSQGGGKYEFKRQQ